VEGVAWVVWAVVAAALGVGELLTPGLFFLGPVALAAVAAAVAAALGAGSVAAVLVFLVCAVLSLLFLRPLARAHLHVPAISRTGTAALVGRKAVVTRKIDVHGGRVRIGGEEWTARPYVDGEEIAEGTSVDVVEIQGATALVMR
jgi:membrane protein implicated in regulation of membrane protease activity